MHEVLDTAKEKKCYERKGDIRLERQRKYNAQISELFIWYTPNIVEKKEENIYPVLPITPPSS